MSEQTSPQPSYNPKDFYTPLEQAVVEIQKRRENKELMQKVHDYLQGDIPEHFNREKPILYMARHIATPNYEAMRFVELGKPYGLPLVISQDKKGKFVSHNELKRALGKLPVTKGLTRRQDEIVENLSVIDFTSAQGKSFNELKTKHGKDFIEFHNSFFKHIYPNEVEIVDESDWIDRNERENLKEQFKRFFALTCVYGIMFEYFTNDEIELANKTFGPAFAEAKEMFGCKPLIVEHINPEQEIDRDWNGYPSVLYQFIKGDLDGTICE